MEENKTDGFSYFFSNPKKKICQQFSFQLILQWQKGEFHTDLHVEKETILSVIPLSFIISPAAIKKGIANKVKESTPEYIRVTIALRGKSP